MQNRFHARRTLPRLTAAISLAFGFLTACFSSMRDGGGPSTYHVYEIEVQRSDEIAGYKFKIAVVAAQLYEDTRREVWFDGQRLPTVNPISSGSDLGYDGLNEPARKQLAVGSTTSFSVQRQTLSSIFSPKPIELASLNSSPALYTLKLLKRCDVEIERDEYTSISWGGSGVIAVPSFKKHQRLAVAKPSCYDPLDRNFELGKVVAVDPEVAKQIAQARVEAEAELAKEAKKKRQTARFLQLTEAKMTEARELAKQATWTAVKDPGFEDQLRNALCPDTIAVARLSKIVGLTADRVEASRIQHVGSMSIRHETSITLEFESGRKEKITVALGKMKIADGIESMRVRKDGCFDIKARENRSDPDYEIVRDIVDVLKNHFKRQIEDAAYLKAQSEFSAE